MNILFLCIVAFLVVLAIFDLSVGVSNDAVNFLNSAIGAKVAKRRTIILVAAVGIFVGAALSNGMMDVARHGIMTPQYFSFYDVMCLFLAVMVTDVILLDMFNSHGMPTSTTVSMVFELLGGSFAIALIRIMGGAADEDGGLLTLGDMLNTEKALSVILGIFLSVVLAFLLGMIVQWVARMVFTFTYRVNGKTTDVKGDMGSLLGSSLKIGIFGGMAVTGIIWFLLINGLKGSSLMTPGLHAFVDDNTGLILGGGLAFFSAVMTVLSAFRVPVLKFVVLFGTFSLAMAFAGNDLVNFVGVPLTGLEAYGDFTNNGNGDAHSYMMQSLMDTAHTPTLYLVIAGVVMVLSLVFSKKAKGVVKTSVDLSRQDEGDEMFGSSAVARVLVRSAQKMEDGLGTIVPKRVSSWVDARFCQDGAILPEGAAFDQIRASVNLVLAGLLVAFGTSMKLPLSTTYVTFMVAMGASLADRAWSRESAVFRITGVLSVIGGWFLTAAIAFFMCYLVTNALYFGSFVAMCVAVVLAVVILVRGFRTKKEDVGISPSDKLFRQMSHSQNKAERWLLLKEHVSKSIEGQLGFAECCYVKITDAFLQHEYRPLRQATHEIETARKQLKRSRRREIIGLRQIDPVLAVEKNTWYFLASSSMEQIVYCLKRINDPCCEHVGNNFTPVDSEYAYQFVGFQEQVKDIFLRAKEVVASFGASEDDVELLCKRVVVLQHSLSGYRKYIIDNMQQQSVNIESATLYLSVIQETQQILSSMRHMLKGVARFVS